MTNESDQTADEGDVVDQEAVSAVEATAAKPKKVAAKKVAAK